MSKEKLSMLSELIKMAKTDKDFRDDEFNFLYAIAQQLGVSDEEFKELFNKYIEFTPPKAELDRIVQFQRLVLMMNVDGEVSKEELHHARSIGLRMGLHPNATNEVLRIMDDYENGVVPPNKLIAIFKAHHN